MQKNNWVGPQVITTIVTALPSIALCQYILLYFDYYYENIKVKYSVLKHLFFSVKTNVNN